MRVSTTEGSRRAGGTREMTRGLLSGVAGVILATLLVVLSVIPAAAQGITLTGGITDPGNVLSTCRQQVLDGQKQLFDATGSNLFLVLVPDTGSTALGDFTDATWARATSLTDQDILAVITTGEPHLEMIQGVEVDKTVTQNELDAINEGARTPTLARDWCAAALALTTGFQEAIKPSGGGGFPTWLVVVLILAVVVAAGWYFLRGRQRNAEVAERSVQEDLGKQATSLLLSTDDALRDADQELGFAEAQFGDDAAKPFADALASARAELREAFTISQQLDDDIPETPEQRRTMLQSIIDKCTHARGLVDEQAAHITQMRDLSKNIDQVLPQTGQSIDAQTARIATATATLATLTGRYQPENYQAVSGNADAAAARLAAARAAVSAGQGALAAGQRDAAVASVQQAESAIKEAGTLLDAIEETQRQLATGETELTASIAAVQQDITQGRAAISSGKAADRAADVERAAALLTQAQQSASTTPLDLVAATRAVTEANTTIDAVLEGVQAADQAAQRNAVAAQTAIANAAASVAQANGLLGAYGATAAGRRAATRVTQAQEYLSRARALIATDPATAAQAAQTADALADEAIAEMQAGNVGGGVQWGGGGGQIQAPPTSYSGGGGGGSGLDSLLGGLIGGMLSGGGGSGRSSGRSGWSGGSGGFGGFGSGGFGGGGSSSRRSSGGGGSSGRSGGGGGSRSSGGGGGASAGRRSSSGGSARAGRRSGF